MLLTESLQRKTQSVRSLHHVIDTACNANLFIAHRVSHRTNFAACKAGLNFYGLQGILSMRQGFEVFVQYDVSVQTAR